MRGIAGESRKEFLEVAETVMERFTALPENPDKIRTGGFLAVMENGKMVMAIELGVCSPEKAEKYFVLCQEKARRLSALSGEGHFSSWQSRDTEDGRYGGGITAPSDSGGVIAGQGMVGAVSGLSEYGDEAVTLVIWMVFRWLVLGDAKRIIDISVNPLFVPLLEACNDLFDRKV
ncbi:MAG: hypothetical protein WC619_04840 [Patescibacteria group bacterium]